MCLLTLYNDNAVDTAIRQALLFFLLQSLDRHVERGSQKKPSAEMNRRAKFLTVEGIQKRKNPDKNYVSEMKLFFFFLSEMISLASPSAGWVSKA